MSTDFISPSGDIVGTRISVYDLLPQFLDGTATEAYLCRMYELAPEQVSAARAYMFNNLETVLTQHLKIETRISAGNPPEDLQHAERTRAAMRSFKAWLIEQPAFTGANANRKDRPNFRDWLAEQESLVGEGS